MDGVAQKAAQTRRLNAERRLSVLTNPHNPTPEPGPISSTPVTAGVKKPSMADYYRAKAATTPSINSLTRTGVNDRTSPHSNTVEGSNGITARRPIILPPKKPAEKSPEPSAPHESDTGFAKSLGGRPYEMVYSMCNPLNLSILASC
jgi:hypothetical protein